MVVQKTLNNLKDRPKEDKQAVAMSTAGVVMILLLIGWTFFFLKSLRQERAASSSYGALDIPADVGAEPVSQTSATYDVSNKNPFDEQTPIQQ